MLVGEQVLSGSLKRSSALQMVFVLRGDAGFVRDQEVEALRRSLQHVLLPLGLRGSEAMPPLLNDFLLCCLPGHIATEDMSWRKEMTKCLQSRSVGI